MKKIFIVSLFLFITFFCLSNQKEMTKEKTNINFYITQNDNIILSSSINNPDSYILNKELFALKVTKEQLYKTGVNLLIFGIACGVASGTFIGTGFIFTYVLSTIINKTFQETFNILITSFSAIYETSYFASLAIASWVLGFVFAGLFLCIIPGIILMAVNKQKNISFLYDSFGFSVKI